MMFDGMGAGIAGPPVETQLLNSVQCVLFEVMHIQNG